MKKQALIALTIAFVFSVFMWGSRFNYQIKLLKSQVLELQRLADEPRVLDLAQDTWKQDHESDLSTFLSVMIAKDIEVGGRTIATLTPDRRLQLCRFLLDWQAKQRSDNRRKADPNGFHIENNWATLMVYLDEDVARQSGLDFLKPYDLNEITFVPADDTNYILTNFDVPIVDTNTATVGEYRIKTITEQEIP